MDKRKADSAERGGNEWNRTLVGQNRRKPKPRWGDAPWLLSPRGGQLMRGSVGIFAERPPEN